MYSTYLNFFVTVKRKLIEQYVFLGHKLFIDLYVFVCSLAVRQGILGQLFHLHRRKVQWWL
jgi:hypothetical protein